MNHWTLHLEKMRAEIDRFQTMADLEQNALEKRIKFINDKQVEMDDSDDHFVDIWSNRLLLDYFHRNSYFLSAEQMLSSDEESELTILSNVRLWHKIKGPLDGIKQRNPLLIIKWCRTNKTLLKNVQNNLAFLCKSRFVVELLRNGEVDRASQYMTNEMAQQCQQWDDIAHLFVCSQFVPLIFSQNEKYKKMINANSNANANEFKRLKKAYKADLKRKIPKTVYKTFFKPGIFWRAIECEFLRVFKAIFGLNKHSMLEYVLGTSLQTLLTPYCYHSEWTNAHCVTCKNNHNKMAKLAHKSKLRGVELPSSVIVCGKETDFAHKEVENGCNEYEIIRDCMVNNEESMTIKSNGDAIVTPNGCVIHKDAAKGMIAKNNWIQNDCKKIYLCYDLF